MTIHRAVSSVLTLRQHQYYDPLTNSYFDLAYITPNLIVCSGPVDDFIRGKYTPNRLDRLVNFLNLKHGETNWKLYNLRAEKLGYEVEDGLNLAHYPIVDHQAPPFEMILKVMEDMTQWLQPTADAEINDHVAVLHCKAGKGRSGTIACCYMLSVRKDQNLTPNDANEIFSKARFVENFMMDNYGVSILSQRRYINYYYHYLHSIKLRDKIDYFLQNEIQTKIVKIYFENCIDDSITVELSVYKGADLVIVHQWEDADTSADDHNDALQFTDPFVTDSQDLRFSFNHNFIGKIPSGSNFAFFNTVIDLFGSKYVSNTNLQMSTTTKSATNSGGASEVTYHNSKTLRWDEIDGFKGTYQRGLKLFDSVTIYYELSYELKEDVLPYINTCGSQTLPEQGSHFRRMFSKHRKN